MSSDHVVKYKEDTFIWRARVSHFSDSVCLDLFETKKLLSKLGFEFTKIKSMAVLNNLDALVEFVENLAVKIFEGSLSGKEYGRMGSTLYFVEHRREANDVELEVVSAMNVVVMEYAIYDHIQYLLRVAAEDLEYDGYLQTQ